MHTIRTIAIIVSQSVSPTLNSLVASSHHFCSSSSTFTRILSKLNTLTFVSSHYKNLQGDKNKITKLGKFAMSLINSLFAVLTITESFEEFDNLFNSFSILKLINFSLISYGILVSLPTLMILERCQMSGILRIVQIFRRSMQI